MTFDVTHPEVRDVIRRALAEDIGTGDITSTLTVAPELTASGSVLAKQQMIVAGVELLPLVYELQGGGGAVELKVESGTQASPGTVLAVVTGPARLLLECERTALNLLQRLSGIATLTRRYVDAIDGTGVRLLDTRKTTPGLRRLEKSAALAGGAVNHRMGLFDAVLIKNNHITAAGGVTEALRRASTFGGPVEIEVRTRQELDEALASGAKRLLLDNLSPAEATEWIRHIAGRASVELSGNVTLETIRAYAEAGPDFISCGAITHSATAADISFRLELDRIESDV